MMNNPARKGTRVELPAGFPPWDAEIRSAVDDRMMVCRSSRRVVSEDRLVEDEFFEKSLNAICLAPLRLLTANSGLDRKLEKIGFYWKGSVLALVDADIKKNAVG
jgi:hypothetical protein